MRFLYHPDTVLTASKLEILAESLLEEIPIPGVGGCDFDSGIIRRTLLQAAVDQKSIKAVTDTTRGTYSDDYTPAQLHTVPPTELELLVNNLFAHQAAMILGPGPRIICLDFVDIHYHGCPHSEKGELCHTKPRDGTSKCHRYLAGFVLCRAKPLVVAVTPVRGDETALLTRWKRCYIMKAFHRVNRVDSTAKETVTTVRTLLIVRCWERSILADRRR